MENTPEKYIDPELVISSNGSTHSDRMAFYAACEELNKNYDQEDFNAVCDELKKNIDVSDYDLTSYDRTHMDELKEEFLMKEIKSAYSNLNEKFSIPRFKELAERIRHKYTIKSSINHDLDEYQEGSNIPILIQQNFEKCLSCNAAFYSVLHSEKCEKPQNGKANYTKIEELKMLWAEWMNNGYGSYPHHEIADIIFDSEEEKVFVLEAYDKIKKEENK